MRVSPSQIKTWKECEQAWYYSYIEGLRLNRGAKHFDIGTYAHELCHVIYQYMKAFPSVKAGSDEIKDMLVNRIDQDRESMTLENMDVMKIVWPLLSQYCSVQTSKIDKGISIIGVEHEVRQEIAPGLIAHGFIDLVYRDAAGQIRVRDHKTSAQKNSWNNNKVKMNEQLLLYALALSQEFDEPVYAVEISFINTYQYGPKSKKPTYDELFKLFRHVHNEQAMKTFKHNLIRTHDRMLESETNPLRNYSESCASCRFFDLCNLETRGVDATLTKNSNYMRIERT